jgi:hypothetical protein
MYDLIVVERIPEWQRLKALVLDSMSSRAPHAVAGAPVASAGAGVAAPNIPPYRTLFRLVAT